MGSTPSATTTRTNGYAIVSLILGIVGLLVQLFGVVPILAIVFGYLGKREAERGAGGRGMAIAGIVLGIIGIALLILALVLVGNGVYPVRR